MQSSVRYFVFQETRDMKKGTDTFLDGLLSLATTYPSSPCLRLSFAILMGYKLEQV